MSSEVLGNDSVSLEVSSGDSVSLSCLVHRLYRGKSFMPYKSWSVMSDFLAALVSDFQAVMMSDFLAALMFDVVEALMSDFWRLLCRIF